MPLRVWTWVGLSNHVLDGGPDPPCEGAILTGKMLHAWQMADWKSKINNTSTTESEHWRNAGPSAITVAGDYVEKW